MLNGFAYGGIHGSVYGLSCQRETHYIMPQQRQYVQEIPGMDGVVDYKIGRYGVRVMTDTIYYDGDYEQLRANRENIIAMFANIDGEPKKLEYDDEPNRYYMAKCYAAIEFENTADRKIGTVQWTCNPPWQYHNDILMTPEQISWITSNLEGIQYLKEFTASGSMRFFNTGTSAVKPIIKLIGYIPYGTTLTYGNAKWAYNGTIRYDSIIIDCAAETVKRGSDGASLYAYVSTSYDDYFVISPGQIEIGLTASGITAWPDSLTIAVEFTPVNGVQ